MELLLKNYIEQHTILSYRHIAAKLKKENLQLWEWVENNCAENLGNRFLAKKLYSALHEKFSFVCPHGFNIGLTAVHNLKFLKNIECDCKSKYIHSIEYKNKKEKSLEKQRQTCLKKYGTEYACQNSQVKQHIIDSNIKKYGVDYPAKIKNIFDKTKRTNLIIYGCEFPLQNEKIISAVKSKLTNKSNYEKKCINKKREDTSLEIYGVSHHTLRQTEKGNISNRLKKLWSNEDWKKRQIVNISKSCQEKYGRYFPPQIKMLEEVWDVLNNKEKFLFEVKEYGVYGFAEKYHIGIMTIYRYCALHDKNLIKTSISSYEHEIENWLKTLNISFITRTRKILNGKELDFYFPSLNIGLEFQGDFWHGNPAFYDGYQIHPIKNISYNEIWLKDLEKKRLCEKNNIELLYIWETDWNFAKDEVKQKIFNCLKR